MEYYLLEDLPVLVSRVGVSQPLCIERPCVRVELEMNLSAALLSRMRRRV